MRIIPRTVIFPHLSHEQEAFFEPTNLVITPYIAGS